MVKERSRRIITVGKGLVVDLYELTMAQIYFKRKPNTLATFDLFIRSPRRPFYVFTGLDEVIEAVESFRFTSEDIDYLNSLTLFEDSFLDYLKSFRFNGDIWGMDDPEIVFSNEPILIVNSNIIQAQLLESIILNKLNLAITLCTKALRVVLAAKGRGIYDFSLRRTQGIEASLAAAKYSYIAGAKGTSNVYAGYLYTIPVVGTMAHSFVMSFEREIESFLSFAQQFPTKSILLIDTYDIERGVEAAIKVAQQIQKMGYSLLGVRIDSGDLSQQARYVRKMLDKEGLIDTVIFASGNLDEYRIDELVSKRAPIDAFGVGTNMGCSSDLPYTDVIYKLVAIKGGRRSFIPTMKLSEEKATLPGDKQVVRFYDTEGLMKKDVVALKGEKIEGQRLLKRVMHQGKSLLRPKSIKEKREILLAKIKKLPPSLKKIKTEFNYPVIVSKGLKELSEQVKQDIVKRTAKRIVFLDIDTQYDFMFNDGKLYVNGAEKIIPNLEKLTSFAKRNNIIIISSQDTHCKSDPEFKEFGPHCIKGSKGWRKIPQTLLANNKRLSYKKVYSIEDLDKSIMHYHQLILEKNILNVFSNPNTLPLFNTLLPDEIYVYGVVTEYCVKEAVDNLLRYHFNVAVVEDAIKEISSLERDKAFSSWRSKGIRFIKTETLLRNRTKCT